MSPKTLFAWLILFVLLPVTTFAHSLFIQAGRYHVHEGKSSPLFFCYGHHIPVDDAVRGKKLRFIRVIRPDGSIQNLDIRDEKSLHSYVVNYDMPGTFTLVAETNPGFFTTWTDKKHRKRHSIKPMSAIADKALSVEGSLRSSQWTKTYVTCEQPSTPFPAHIGLPLELVPSRDVGSLHQGDTLRLQVYKNGSLYTGEGFWDATYNGFSTQAEDMYIPRQTYKGGSIEIPLDVPGRWFVRFFAKTLPTGGTNKDYLLEKRTATLVFEVPNARKRPKSSGH
ncbi:MAG: hypothetical protein CSA21_06320 [Deltaproteobacteria bacterium]|nr:MAG: hypothetical protein CSA21_06320 [Deltaproteobacteria bacterium]